MWDFFSRITQRSTQRQQQAQGFRFTVIAPKTRGEAETMALRENAEDLGAAAALVQVIEASTPPRARLVERQTVSLHVRTHVSDVSADSEEYIRNPYEDTGRRRRSPRQQVANSPSSPLAVNSAVQASNSPSSPLAAVSFAQDSESSEEDYVEVEIPEEIPEGAEIVEPQSLASNLLEDPVGTFLHVAAAAVLVSGPPGRQYVSSGPPPPDQRGGRARSSTVVRLLPTPSVPLPPVLTRRPRAHSSPVESDTSRIRPRLRSARTV